MNKKVEADGYTYDYYLESQPILWSNPNFTGPLWYSQQYFYIYYTPAAAQPIKVEYVTNSGQVLGTGEATYTSDGASVTTPSVGDSYQTVQKTFTGYTFSHMETGAGTLPADGIVPKNGGTVVYVYTPTEEEATVTFVDQTTGKTLQTVTVTTVTGAYGTTSQYQPTNLINYYESLGYVVVSDNYPASGVTFNQNGTVQKFTIVLKHGTTTYTPSNNPQNLDLTNTVTQTITYVYSTGGTAAPTKTTTITLYS